MATRFFETTARVESGVITVAAGNNPAALREVSGFNDGATTVYFQLFDKAAVPVNPDTPKQQTRVAAGATFEGDFNKLLRPFPNSGIAFGFSTTPDVFTPGAGLIGWVEAAYESKD